MAQEYVWLITGANRGIGLGIVKQLVQSPSNTIIATCRIPAKAAELQALAESASGRVSIVALDVSNKDSIIEAAQEVSKILGGKGIDYLINNAAVAPGGKDTAFNMDGSTLTETFVTNVVGPAIVAEAFIGLIEKSAKKTIVNVSSTLGSLNSDLSSLGIDIIYASYSISKTALNMLTYKQAKERPDITVISLCPGGVQTDMGGPTAPQPISVAVEGVLKTILSLKHEDTGKFYNQLGEIVPW